MTAHRQRSTRIQFGLNGRVQPLFKGTASGYVPTRPMGGWLASYAALGPNGGVVPVTDRQGHLFEAAQALGQIDFADYLAKGVWNDTHTGSPVNPKPKITVGIPTVLEYHDQLSLLAKAHCKVGWWTEGHLFDRADPGSWEAFTDYKPTETDLDRADYFWELSTLLKGTPREIGISAEGDMITSPCGERIIWARIREAAVCEIPQNPLSTLQPLVMGTQLRLDMVGASPCDTCSCPPNACRNMRLNKAVTVATAAPLVGEDLEGVERSGRENTTEPTEKVEKLVELLMQAHKVPRNQALRWVSKWLASRPSSDSNPEEASNAHAQA